MTIQNPERAFGWIVRDLRAGRGRHVIDAYSREPIQPEELWMAWAQAWVRLDGSWISGWTDEGHYGFRPTLIGRWRIRRAARVWRSKQ